jgi:hypothetical protein
MARPKKIGLDYFPVDVQFDRKIEAIELLYGNDGLVWVLKFWQQAYQTELGEIKLDGLFGELFTKNCRITPEQHDKIIKSAIEINLIKKLPDGLYTSDGIKKRMSAVSSERKKAIQRKNKRLIENKEKGKESKTPPDYSTNNLTPLNRVIIDQEKKDVLKISKIIIYPTVEEMEKYFVENGYSAEHAQKVFKYYSIADWYDSKGNKVKNWKQKCQAVWFKDENKIQKTKEQYYEEHCAKMREQDEAREEQRRARLVKRSNTDIQPIGDLLNGLIPNQPQ